MTYEHFIRKAAGLGKAATDYNDPDRYEKTNAHTDVLVVGGGASGLLAALSAGRAGARVILADEQNEFGGWLLSESDTTLDGNAADQWIADAVAELEAMENVTMLKRTTVFGYMDHNYLTMMERVTDHLAETPSICRVNGCGKFAPSMSCWHKARMNDQWSLAAMTAPA